MFWFLYFLTSVFEENCFEYHDGIRHEKNDGRQSLCTKPENCGITILKTAPVFELNVESDVSIEFITSCLFSNFF
jgi:hypothetical protein